MAEDGASITLAAVESAAVGSPVPMANTPAHPASAAESVPYSCPP